MNSSFAGIRQGSNDGGGGNGGGRNPKRRSIDQVSIAATQGSARKSSPTTQAINGANGKMNANEPQRQNGGDQGASSPGNSWAMTQYQNDYQAHEARAYRLAQMSSQQAGTQSSKTSSAKRR